MAVTNYLWDDDNIALETDEADATIAEYTYEPEQYGNLISERRSGTTYQHHYDALGSTRMLTDENGQITDTFDFDAWGNELARTGITETPFRNVGEIGYYFDGETRDYYVRARVYSPTIARWTSVDPIGQRALGIIEFTSAYWYAHNRPVNLVDPSGLVTVSFSKDVRFPFIHFLCGGRKLALDVKFAPAADAKGSLVVVQQVTHLVRLQVCYEDKPGCCDHFCTESFECKHWETDGTSWTPDSLRKGTIEELTTWLSFSRPRIEVEGAACPNTRGWHYWQFEIRVFELTTKMLSELRKFKKKVTCQGMAVSVKRSTGPPEPNFWSKNKVVDRGFHWGQTDWNCCTEKGQETQCTKVGLNRGVGADFLKDCNPLKSSSGGLGVPEGECAKRLPKN